MYRRAMIDLNGGSNKVKYSMIANYVGGNGFEKIGDRPDLNRLNVRGNLDIQVTDYLSVIADAAARLEMKIGVVWDMGRCLQHCLLLARMNTR